MAPTLSSFSRPAWARSTSTPTHAPITTANFLAYVDNKFYDGTIFHRVIPGFVVQGGGFTPDMSQKTTTAPIKNEAATGCTTVRGTISMARTNDPDSATSQFFLNLVDNSTSKLDPGGISPRRLCRVWQDHQGP